MPKLYEGPCSDPTCNRGAIDDYNYQYKDGPCKAYDCQWPAEIAPRPHFTDFPATPIVDAGKVALAEKNSVVKSVRAKS